MRAWGGQLALVGAIVGVLGGALVAAFFRQRAGLLGCLYAISCVAALILGATLGLLVEHFSKKPGLGFGVALVASGIVAFMAGLPMRLIVQIRSNQERIHFLEGRVDAVESYLQKLGESEA